MKIPGSDETGAVRTGITAILPCTGDLFHNHLVAGGFVLNGIGEMSGLTQAMEWGWLETPILLTNTMSVGHVHAGIVQHMLKEHPELGREVDVIIPLVGETNDAFLNEVRIPAITPDHAMQAIAEARGGPVEQGSVGGGTGMISFDFAGGIGTSSRVLPKEAGGYTVGVLVQANFGKMHNLTIDGSVVGRELDPLYPYEGRRGKSYGSVITVVATDAPMLSSQLNQVSKRAALGLGRVGSYAATTSGEIVFAFSTANRVARQAKERDETLKLDFISGDKVDLLYEAVVEATEEAVLNSMFCSPGMDGKDGRYAPPLPISTVQQILNG
ncbi:MAG: S58 family peptidase [Desulfuromonadales bacterium]|nr:S58 family peptidase [Desulfuromonadales bacterium]NIR33485.1 S58 family peptidase [Desulfuromonadales bacterium]